jgi:hypothetical protein
MKRYGKWSGFYGCESVSQIELSIQVPQQGHSAECRARIQEALANNENHAQQEEKKDETSSSKRPADSQLAHNLLAQARRQRWQIQTLRKLRLQLVL